jgi:hypothetical protein
MAQKHSANSFESGAAPMAFLSFGETAVSLQKELFRTYQRLNRTWMERLEVELALWSRLASDLASSKSAVDVLKAYADHTTRQFRVSAEEVRDILSDYQEIARKIAVVDVENVSATRDPEPEAAHDFGSESRITH